MKNFIILTITTLLFLPLSAGTLLAQIERVELRVDGLACPFCAYGLEKKLKAVSGVDNISINVDKGVVILKSKGQASIEVEKLGPAVKDAGFTPRELSVTAVGKISQSDSGLVLLVSGSDTEFILKSNPKISLKETTKPVKVTGQLTQETPKGHHAHPYILTIAALEDK